MANIRFNIKEKGYYIYEGSNNIRILDYSLYIGQEVEVIIINGNDNYIHIFDKSSGDYINRFPISMIREFIKKEKLREKIINEILI